MVEDIDGSTPHNTDSRVANVPRLSSFDADSGKTNIEDGIGCEPSGPLFGPGHIPGYDNLQDPNPRTITYLIESHFKP